MSERLSVAHRVMRFGAELSIVMDAPSTPVTSRAAWHTRQVKGCAAGSRATA